jgi:hypothetical protein
MKQSLMDQTKKSKRLPLVTRTDMAQRLSIASEPLIFVKK